MREERQTIYCEVEEIQMENDRGRMIDSVEVTCPLCDESETSFGTHDGSIKRCLVKLKETCGCDNFLIAE